MDRSSKGCNTSGPHEEHEEHEVCEPYVEAEGELVYLSDGDDVIAPPDDTEEPKGNSWTHAVDLDKQQCTCKEWQLSGKPCSHAISFICTLREAHLEDYVHEYYSVDRFRLAYAGVITPIGDRSRWLNSDPGFIVHPPNMKRPAGRPRKERIPGCLELGTRKQQCKRCKGFGHQARTCKEPADALESNSGRNRNRRR